MSEFLLSFTKEEVARMQRVRTPALVQDLLCAIPSNHEHDGVDTIKSPLRVLRENSAHCIEAAILGAYILSLHGHSPLLIHLQTVPGERRGKPIDYDHVIAPFQIGGLWGALSKSNHAVLRYRDPVYKTVRELALSYFHEYVNDAGEKTLRRYSRPLDLSIFKDDWAVAEEDLWGIDEELDRIRHFDIAPESAYKALRRADPIEAAAGKIVEWQ